jgi:hypothetical protein
MFAVRQYIEDGPPSEKARADRPLKVSKQHFDRAIKLLREQNGR